MDIQRAISADIYERGGSDGFSTLSNPDAPGKTPVNAPTPTRSDEQFQGLHLDEESIMITFHVDWIYDLTYCGVSVEIKW